MKNQFFIVILLIAIFSFVSCYQNIKKESETSTYYLIRHAEKDRSDETNKDPNLTEEGQKRAVNWSNYFKDLKFDCVYTTDYNRTKQTAEPTAKANGLEMQLYNPVEIKIDEFIMSTKGKTVLIVGHSNTIPEFVNQLIDKHKYEDIADDNNANLYVVKNSKSGKTSQLLVVD